MARQSAGGPFRIHLHPQAWLVAQPRRRFLLQARPLGAAPHAAVASKQELKHRIMAAMDEFNRDPVVHTWSYRLDLAA